MNIFKGRLISGEVFEKSINDDLYELSYNKGRFHIWKNCRIIKSFRSFGVVSRHWDALGGCDE